MICWGLIGHFFVLGGCLTLKYHDCRIRRRHCSVGMQPHFLRPVCFEGVAFDWRLSVFNNSYGNFMVIFVWWPLERVGDWTSFCFCWCYCRSCMWAVKSVQFVQTMRPKWHKVETCCNGRKQQALDSSCGKKKPKKITARKARRCATANL